MPTGGRQEPDFEFDPWLFGSALGLVVIILLRFILG